MIRQHRRQPQLPRVQGSVKKTGMERFSSSLSTFQQVLGVVHSAAPYIERYGPVVQKLPTLYRMYRAIKNVDEPTAQVDSEDAQEVSAPTEEQNSQVSSSLPENYPSPKLYI